MITEELPVFRPMYGLLAETDEVVINFPKMRKHTDGRFMKELVLDAIRALYKANSSEAHSETRRAAQEEIIYLLGCYRTILRLMNEKKVLTIRQVDRLTVLLDSVGRQVTAWKNRGK